jgi:drug/metabolite transporter (DMT)-like permease
MVLFGSIAAYLIFYYALRHIEASRVASYAYLQPVMATTFAVVLLGESLTISLMVGISIILTGVLITERGREVFDWLV